ncbi:MAG: two-component system sensor histidine kinase PilS (NtrC family) [Burkholderiaceae bacterium]|jgi:two-component system sensor histidine kinase PilS (NtrC family)
MRHWRAHRLTLAPDDVLDPDVYAGASSPFWRTLQAFTLLRFVIALLLLGFVGVVEMRGTGGDEAVPYLQLSSVYLFASAAFWVLAVRSRERFLLQLSSQIGVDIVIIATLFVLAGGTRSGLAILFLFPLAGGAILAPLILALFFTSLVALVLLFDSVWQSLRMIPDVSISTSGLYGMGFFAAALLLNRLASKLIKQESLAAQRGQALQLQEAINALIIADMGDGILVLEEDTTIVTGNPAAQSMLGVTLEGDGSLARLADSAVLAPIAEAWLAWTRRASSEDAFAIYVMLKPAGRRDLSAHLKLRFATVHAPGRGAVRTVIFMQDVTEIENRAQDLKLASMGRLTASIAHEVRNPLSAISHAASLLEEDAPDPTQVRLLAIIDDNVARLNRMIEDILKLSRKAQPLGEPLSLSAFFADLLPEFRDLHGLPEQVVVATGAADYRVRFDPLHLREVVVNLLSNALRYASGRSGSIRLDVIALATNRIELHVQDDGVPITPSVRAHLFEPFYTTSSKGTGLGLYLARELCLNNEAMLDYEYRLGSDDEPAPSGRFVITFATANIL